MIITNNEEALRVFCEPVTLEETGQLIEALEKELEYGNRIGRAGIGLAAAQIDILKSVAIVRLPKISLNLVNAKIDKSFDPAIFEDEACLSFPGRVENTMRFQEVHVSNNLVEPHNFIATGLLAVVVQHEINHLNSILFFDHKVSKPVLTANMAKIGLNDKCLCGSNLKYKRCCRRLNDR
jgi:peptide deformylase